VGLFSLKTEFSKSQGQNVLKSLDSK